MTLNFVVTPGNVVHLDLCREYGGGVAYRPSLSTLTVDAMLENLKRVDVKDKYEYPGLLTPCTTCLGG